MAAYEGPPVCQRCGGALRFDDEPCWCGGRSQFVTGTRYECGEDASCPQEDNEPERRVLSWRQAMDELRRRYVPPA